MKKFFLTVLLNSLSFIIYAQKGSLILFLTAPDSTGISSNQKEIKKIRREWFNDSLYVILAGGQKEILPDNLVWGFKDEDGSIYRNYNEKFIRVEQIGSMIIYHNTGRYGQDYFSKMLNTPVYEVNYKNLSTQFKEDTCLLSMLKKQFKWYEAYASKNKKTGKFKLIEIEDLCRQKN